MDVRRRRRRHFEDRGPDRRRASGVTAAPPPSPTTDPSAIVASEPAHGAHDAARDRPLGLRVAPPLTAEGVAAGVIELQGPAGLVAVRGILTEGGRLVFVTPEAPLDPGAPYTLTVHVSAVASAEDYWARSGVVSSPTGRR